MDEIDLLAEVLTGNRRHFWLKPHSTPESCKPVGPQPDTYDAEWERRKAERDKERAGKPMQLSGKAISPNCVPLPKRRTEARLSRARPYGLSPRLMASYWMLCPASLARQRLENSRGRWSR
jgi:hypothetical protein